MPADLLPLLDGAERWHGQARSTLSDLDRSVRDHTEDKGLLAPWAHFVRGIRAHLDEEETLLFPALRALAAGRQPRQEGWEEVLEEMEQELDEIRTISDALRNASREAGPLERDILDLLDALEVHAEREQQEILPLARALVASAADPGSGAARSPAGDAPVDPAEIPAQIPAEIPAQAPGVDDGEGPGGFATQHARPGGQLDVGLGRGGYAPSERGLRATARRILGALRG